MIITKTQLSRLLDDLEKIGWHRRNILLYAPNETMWLRIADPWTGDLQTFHDCMVGRLKSYHNLRVHQSESENKKGIDDVTGLIQILHTMILDGAHVANKPLEPVAVGTARSAVAVRVASRQ